MAPLADEVNLPLDAADRAIQSIFAKQSCVEAFTATESDYVGLLKARYRIVRIDADLPADVDLAFISPAFLKVARAGHLAIGKFTVGKEDGAQSISTRSMAIINAARSAEYKLLSPFSGQLERVWSSIGREWYFHSLDGRVCLASQMGSPMIAVNLEATWVFPAEHLILYVSNGIGEPAILQETARLYQRCGRRASELVSYLALEDRKETRALAITDFWCPHIAHNLWNLQTGWGNVLSNCDVSGIACFLLQKRQSFFGDISELFPEKVPSQDKIIWVASDDDVFNAMLTENLFLYTVKDELVTADLAKRIIDHARATCSAEFLDEVALFRATAHPIVVTTIRLDNRAWIEQREGLAALFQKLRGAFPRMGLIIDGLSNDSSKGWTTEWMSMQAEIEVAETVRDALPPDMPVVFSVGRKFAEAIVLIDSADLFIAPTGSGMTLYKWLSNLPGLAFSNRSVLDEASPHRWNHVVWHNKQFRADITSTIHISPDLVRDGDLARGNISRANFHLDWRDLYEVSVPVIKAIPGINFQAPATE